MAGAIEYGATARIKFELTELMKYPDGKLASWLCLLSARGNVVVASDVSRTLRYLGLDTCVVPVTDPSILRLPGVPSAKSGTQCASACVTLFLGDRKWFLLDEASIAVHQVRSRVGPALYNHRRLHSILGYVSPMRYEANWQADQSKKAA